jgi:hypothetical protein
MLCSVDARFILVWAERVYFQPSVARPTGTLFLVVGLQAGERWKDPKSLRVVGSRICVSSVSSIFFSPLLLGRPSLFHRSRRGGYIYLHSEAIVALGKMEYLSLIKSLYVSRYSSLHKYLVVHV